MKNLNVRLSILALILFGLTACIKPEKLVESETYEFVTNTKAFKYVCEEAAYPVGTKFELIQFKDGKQGVIVCEMSIGGLMTTNATFAVGVDNNLCTTKTMYTRNMLWGWTSEQKKSLPNLCFKKD